MPLSTVSEVSNINSRVIALKERHAVLAQELDEARKSPSVDNIYINILKKRKLMVKEKLMYEEEMARQTA